LWTVPAVPFHPDETTHLYLSADFDQLVLRLDPAGVTWLAPDSPDALRRLRLIEAPLSRYLIGLGRALGGYAAWRQVVDWDWSATWVANAERGALPDPGLLTAARIPATVLTVLTPLLLYSIGRQVTNPIGGLAAAVVFAVSGLALLHGRRAMSEGPLLFCSALVFWLALAAARRRPEAADGVQAGPEANNRRRKFAHWPVLLGAAVGVAATAKLTGWALLPAAGAAILLNAGRGRAQAKRWASALRVGAMLSAAMLAAWLFNPALWAQPVTGTRVMIATREWTLAVQTGALQNAGSQALLETPGEHLLAELYHLYFAPLAFWDVPNYAAQTGPAEASYQANWLNTGWRLPGAMARLALGGVVLGLTLAAVVFAGLHWQPPGAANPALSEAGPVWLLAVWTLSVVAGLFAFDIAWQRYYLPLLPSVCVWAGCGFAGLLAPPVLRPANERHAASRPGD
jgi:4-amino-4-deoxy-L-arabinose transferase-like glycosyltransferase